MIHLALIVLAVCFLGRVGADIGNAATDIHWGCGCLVFIILILAAVLWFIS
jgi:hypothetical protein